MLFRRTVMCFGLFYALSAFAEPRAPQTLQTAKSESFGLSGQVDQVVVWLGLALRQVFLLEGKIECYKSNRTS